MSAPYPAATERWTRGLQDCQQRLALVPPPAVAGRLTRMVGLTLEAEGVQAAVGDRCQVISSGDVRIDAEVVGFTGERLYLMPTGDLHGRAVSVRLVSSRSGYGG